MHHKNRTSRHGPLQCTRLWLWRNNALTVKCLRQWSHPSPLICTWAEPQTSATNWTCSFQNCEKWYWTWDPLLLQYLIVILCFLLLCFATLPAIYKLQIPCLVTGLLQLANRKLQIPSAVTTITNSTCIVHWLPVQNTNNKWLMWKVQWLPSQITNKNYKLQMFQVQWPALQLVSDSIDCTAFEFTSSRRKNFRGQIVQIAIICSSGVQVCSSQIFLLLSLSCRSSYFCGYFPSKQFSKPIISKSR